MQYPRLNIEPLGLYLELGRHHPRSALGDEHSVSEEVADVASHLVKSLEWVRLNTGRHRTRIAVGDSRLRHPLRDAEAERAFAGSLVFAIAPSPHDLRVSQQACDIATLPRLSLRHCLSYPSL